MIGDERRIREAADLMRTALVLLDSAGQGLAAARLQHALDVLGEQTEEDFEEEAAVAPECRQFLAGHLRADEPAPPLDAARHDRKT